MKNLLKLNTRLSIHELEERFELAVSMSEDYFEVSKPRCFGGIDDNGL